MLKIALNCFAGELLGMEYLYQQTGKTFRTKPSEPDEADDEAKVTEEQVIDDLCIYEPDSMEPIDNDPTIIDEVTSLEVDQSTAVVLPVEEFVACDDVVTISERPSVRPADEPGYVNTVASVDIHRSTAFVLSAEGIVACDDAATTSERPSMRPTDESGHVNTVTSLSVATQVALNPASNHAQDSIPGYGEVQALAEYLVTLIDNTTISSLEVDMIVHLWNLLDDHDKGHIRYPDRYKAKQNTGRFAIAKTRTSSTIPGKESVKRYLSTLTNIFNLLHHGVRCTLYSVSYWS